MVLWLIFHSGKMMSFLFRQDKKKISERTLTIRGEVQYPGIYQYAENETIEDFVLQAGGLTDKASTINVLVSRRVNDAKATRPDSIIAKTYTLAPKDGFVVDGTPGFKLMPFDEVSIRKSPAYTEQQNVMIEGEVMFGGTYTLDRRNARLSDLFKKAGGSTDQAYIKGARLMRKANEAEKTRMEAVLKMQRDNSRKIFCSWLQAAIMPVPLPRLQRCAEC